MEPLLTLRIVLERPPVGVDFALQQGRGSNYKTLQKQRSARKDLYFEFTLGVKAARDEGMPVFVGPLAQGPPAERFIYLDIGTYAGQKDSCLSRRLKIPLSGITWGMIDQLAVSSQMVLEARVPGTGRDGGPNCATAKPFDGWKLRARKR